MKFAFIAPRYGAEISQGAEHACRLLAEQVSERHDVDVLTTCARDPFTWKNEYSEGFDRVRGVLVRRFAVAQAHDRIGFEQLSYRLFSGGDHSRPDEIEWLRRLGPWTPGLVEHIKRQHRSYDALVYFSLLQPTTLHGFAVAPERSILFPHVAPHPALRFGLWREVMDAARAVGFMSRAERRLARAYLTPDLPFDEVVGIGIDPAQQQTYPRHQQDPADDPATDDVAAESDEPSEPTYLTGRGVPFRRRHRLYGPFVVYGGRVDADNGCEEMLEYFDAYAGAGGEADLVLTGVKMMKLPELRQLRMAGVLPDRERVAAFEAAAVTIAPAAGDLLAQSVLESFAVGTPVLASAQNSSAVEHCRRANAGLYYANREEFVDALRLMTGNTRLRERLGENARQYVRQHYRWDAVIGRFERLVNHIKAPH